MRAALILTTLTFIASAAAMPCAADSSSRPNEAVPQTPASMATEVDDGWRRTSLGWQHVSSWSQPATLSATEHVTGRAAKSLLAFGFIICGVLGGIALLLVEIDPMEYDAFRLKSRRSGSCR